MYNKVKFLARWTIGPVSDIGKQILRESVNNFSKIYPEFKRVVCYNHIEKLDINAELYKQEDLKIVDLRKPDDNVEEASGCGWKLCPPRLLPDGMELWIDNDIVINKRLPALDLWIKKQSGGIISEGLHRNRMYGEFDRFVLPDLHLCAGLFGLPAEFDFQERIEHYWKFATKPLGGYDEQGLTAAIVSNMSDWTLVPLSELYICEDHVPFPELSPSAIHFVGANRKPWHRGWKAYQRRKII